MEGEIRLETLSLKRRSLFFTHSITLDYVQVPIPVIDQETNLEQDKVDLIPIQNEKIPIQNEDIIYEEQTQQPQEQMPPRRSTREMRKTISDHYVVFLQEHEDEINMVEDDSIKFH